MLMKSIEHSMNQQDKKTISDIYHGLSNRESDDVEQYAQALGFIIRQRSDVPHNIVNAFEALQNDEPDKAVAFLSSYE